MDAARSKVAAARGAGGHSLPALQKELALLLALDG